ncbi:hypothetical protein BDV96DRAFT_642628 [Lophiotrema nucula]|uniref:SET domain-containing protein n=1 Tax=Lophiotrema nucula TaxID=690887 RepID=A0A6A5ZN18_9PLEO|nr:hypothetical protein BDV96DRAFT_642628 [Lophiotrema nucula]
MRSRLVHSLSLTWLGLAVLSGLAQCDDAASDPSIGSDTIDNILGQNINQQPLKNPETKFTPDPKHAPWTHKPLCAKALDPTAEGEFKKVRKRFCVHSFARKAKDAHSAAIIMPPSLAETTSEFLDEDPKIQFLNDKQIEKWNEKSRSYEVVDIEGKGKGVKATRKIRQFETFMFDQAAIVVDLELEGKLKIVSKNTTQETLIVRAVERMNDSSLIESLSTGGGGKKKGEERYWMQLMERNAFGTNLGEVDVKALFPNAARINHACNPNAFVMFSPSGLSIGIKAYRDIEVGEEITISYLMLGMTSHQRHANLERWGFKCTCDLCSSPPDILAASDARRKRISAAEAKLVSHWQAKKFGAAIRLAEEVVELMKVEELTPMLTDEYVMLAKLHLMAGDRHTAEEHADTAIEILKNLGFLGKDGYEDDEGPWDMERLMKLYGDEMSIKRNAPDEAAS